MRSIKRFYFFVTFGIELKRETSCTVSRKKGDQMKKSIILPIILALGVGMSFAQKKGSERISGRTRLATDSVITIDDGTLYHKTMRKGSTETSINSGDVIYTQCVKGVCSETSKFDSASYSWQKRDLSSGEWRDYIGSLFKHNGEYRLQVKYTYNVGMVSVTPRIRAENKNWLLQYQRVARNSLQNHPIDSVSVNGNTFSPKSLNSCESHVSCDTSTTSYKCYLSWSCVFVADSISTVGKAHPVVLKPYCTDGSNKCKAEYTGPAESYSDDSVKFTVKNKNEDYGWGLLPEDGCLGFGVESDICSDIDVAYALNIFNLMFVGIPVNSVIKSRADSLFITARNYARVGNISVNDEAAMSAFFNDNAVPYVYKDTQDVADTIYYPLTKRDISINYEKSANGTVTGPEKAHDGEVMYLRVTPEDGYGLDTISSRGYDENNEIKNGVVQPIVSEMLADGSYIVFFVAQKGFEQNIIAEFKKVGQEVSMIKPTNGTYSVISRTKEHKVSEKSFITNAANSNIAVRAEPDKGYAVKSVTCSYITKEDGEVTNNLMLGEDSLYSCAIPDTSVLSEDILDRTKQIKIIVTFAKESKIDIDVTGHGTVIAYIKGSIDSAGNYTKGYCSSNPTETEGKACTALDGDSILIEVEDSEGHPLQQLSCKDGTTTTNCKDSKTFVMKAVDAQIVAVFNALNYALTKTGNHVDDFDLYVGWDSKTPATQAHEFDTVYVRSKDGKHLVSLTSMELSFVYTTVDPSTGVALNYFIMPAKPLEIAAALYSTVNLARKVVGKGTVAISWFGGDPEILEDKDLARASVNLDVFSFEKSVPAEGYTYDTTMCYYDDGTALPALASGSNVATFKAEEEQDVTCKIIFNPKTYKIAWSQADTNGFVQGVPEKGKTDESISFKVSPVADYEIDFVKAYYTEKDSSNKDVSVFLKLSNTYDKKKNTYTYKFTMPAHDVDVEVAFKEIKSSSSSAKAKSSSSSAKAKSSSSKAKAKSSSSSAKAKSSSSKAKAKSSSSKKKTILAVMAQVPQFSLFVNGRSMQIAGARVGSKMEVFDLQGHRVLSGNVDAANFSVAMPRSGSYLVRIDGQTQNVNIK